MNDVIKLIEEAENILIIAHDSEDADAAGSSFAMRHALLDIGKKAECVFSDKLEKHLDFMEKDYRIYDDSFFSNAELLICLDCSDVKRFEKRAELFKNAKHTVSIDHHETNDFFAEANYVDGNAAATGEILYELFEKMGITITQDIAKNLFTAISADTGSFKYSNVSSKTMEIAGKLIGTGINHSEISRLLHDTDPFNVIKLKAHIMNSIEEYFDGKLTIVTAKKNLLSQFGVDERDTGDIVNIARSTANCKIAVSIRETDEKIKISFRSNCEISVSEIAKKFGGGGHKKAAGASQCGKTIDEVKAEIIKICEEELNG